MSETNAEPSMRKRRRLLAFAVLFPACACFVVLFGRQSPGELLRRDLFHAYWTEDLVGMKRALNAGADPNARFSNQDTVCEQKAEQTAPDTWGDRLGYWRNEWEGWRLGKTPWEFTRSYYKRDQSIFGAAFASACGSERPDGYHYKCVALLLQHGADPDALSGPFYTQPVTPLTVAAQFPDARLTRLLLRFGADPTLPGHKAPPPLQAAARGGNALPRSAPRLKNKKGEPKAAPQPQPKERLNVLRSKAAPP